MRKKETNVTKQNAKRKWGKQIVKSHKKTMWNYKLKNYIKIKYSIYLFLLYKIFEKKTKLIHKK